MARRKGVPACQRGFFIFVSSRPGRTEGAASRTQMVLLLLVALPRRSGRTLPRLPAAHVAPGAARQGPANHRRLLLHRERVLLVGSPRGRDGRHVAVVRNRPSGGPSSGRVLSPSAAAPGCVAVVHASPRHGSVCDDGPRAGPLRRSQPVPVRARSHRGGGDLIEGLGSVVIFGAWTGLHPPQIRKHRARIKLCQEIKTEFTQERGRLRMATHVPRRQSNVCASSRETGCAPQTGSSS
mmetsp:Transcript_85710/g.171570  ORF Transcript_85710/g.171570 Transcript_85710/m.171570 type:complete len:238 (-) Transcript_85710:366-1079(-)